MAQSSQCAHAGCKCNIPQERAAQHNPYCSDYCQQHSATAGHQAHNCACGHPACK